MFLIVEKIPPVAFPQIRPGADRVHSERRIVPDVNRLDALFVFAFPGSVIGTGEAHRVIHANRDLDLTAGTGRKPQPRVGFTASGENRHHGPIATTENPLESLFVHTTRFGRVTGMRMQPEPEELLWKKPRIHLLIEKVGHTFVVECDGDHARPLTDQPHIVDQ